MPYQINLVMLAVVLQTWTNDAAAQDSLECLAKLRVVTQHVLNLSPFRFIDRLTGREFDSTSVAPPIAELTLSSPYIDWRYWNGVLNIGMLHAGEVLSDSACLRFPRKNIAFSFDNYRYFEHRYKGEGKWAYPFAQRFIMEELDDCGAMGASVIEVYWRDPQIRYLEYLDRAAAFIEGRQSRLPDGALARSFPQRWTLWADDLYMSVSLLSRMGALSGDKRYFNDALRQVIRFHEHLFDQAKGLMTHCWYSNPPSPGVAFWGRANGWAVLAQVDLLDRLPDGSPGRDSLIVLLRRHLLGIARYQSSNGLWHQLLDKEDSYLETSCSAMFTYAFARAVNKGYVDARYATVARRGWEGVMTRIRPDGGIDGVCEGTGVSDDLVFYYRRPTPPNDVHGTGAVLLAGTEVLRLDITASLRGK